MSDDVFGVKELAVQGLMSLIRRGDEDYGRGVLWLP